MTSKPHRIDVHHHILPPDYLSTLSRLGINHVGRYPFPDWDVENTLAFMDRNGIATGLASISAPGVYFGDSGLAKDLARRCNEYSANLVRNHPQRFGAFAVLPLPDIKAALMEVEYALDTLHLDGIVLLTNIGGRYLGDPEFDELYGELNRRKAVVFTHPTIPPGSDAVKLDMPAPLVDFVFDTTRAATNLIYTGTVERYPQIRFILSQAGGAMPFLTLRLSLMEQNPRVKERIPQGIVTYLKRFYYDTALSASPYAPRPLQELVDPSHILFGADYPFAPEPMIAATVAGIKEYDGFDEQTRIDIERNNFLPLFPRLEKL